VPSRMIAPMPTHVPFPIEIVFAQFLPARRSCVPASCDPVLNITPGAISTGANVNP
jgi:hypothetical protein